MKRLPLRALRAALVAALVLGSLGLSACHSSVFNVVHHPPVTVFQESMGIAPGGPCARCD